MCSFSWLIDIAAIRTVEGWQDSIKPFLEQILSHVFWRHLYQEPFWTLLLIWPLQGHCGLGPRLLRWGEISCLLYQFQQRREHGDVTWLKTHLLNLGEGKKKRSIIKQTWYKTKANHSSRTVFIPVLRDTPHPVPAAGGSYCHLMVQHWCLRCWWWLFS